MTEPLTLDDGSRTATPPESSEGGARGSGKLRAGWKTLGLPLRAVRGAWVAAAAVLVYYAATMARDLSFYDSAELALVAVEGGLGHPLGQPLHTLLGWLVTFVPGVPPLLALNFLSALFTALAVIPLVSLAEGLAGRGAESPSAEPALPAEASGRVRLQAWLRPEVLLPLGVALVFLHPVLWENGTRVEVYALAFGCGAWGAARAGATLAPRPEGGGGWLGAGVALGLAASANAFMAFVIALGLAPALGLALYRRRLGAFALLRAAAGGLLGLLPFLYVPLVAHRTGAFVWGAPTSGEALSRYLTNADFAHNRGMTAAGFFAHVWEWSGWALENGLLPVVALGLVAHGAWGRRAGLGRGFGAIVFLGIVYVLCINVIFYPEVTDYLGYLSLPVGVLGAGVAALVARGLEAPGRRRWLVGLLGVVTLVSLVAAPPTPFERTRHRDRLARILSEGALGDAPRGAVLLVSSDHWAFPLLYLQEVERRRPDVVVVPIGLSGASWYWAHLRRRHPGLRDFALRGTGGRVGRMRRFREANPGRPWLFEDFSTAAVYGVPACPGRWLVGDAKACEGSGEEEPDRLTEALEREVDRIGAGSPPAAAVIARVSLDRGELLWRYGLPREALRALRAGVPSAERPSLPKAALDRLPGAGRLSAPPLTWAHDVLIGHPARNLFLAAQILAAAGAEPEARAHLRAAAAAGLPEARRALGEKH